MNKLCFKTVTGTPERNQKLMELAHRKGISWREPLSGDAPFVSSFLTDTVGIYIRNSKMSRECSLPLLLEEDLYPEITWDTAIKLLSEVPDKNSNPGIPSIYLTVNPGGDIEFYPEQYEVTKKFKALGYVFRTPWYNWGELVHQVPCLLFSGFFYEEKGGFWSREPVGQNREGAIVALPHKEVFRVLTPAQLQFFVLGEDS